LTNAIAAKAPTATAAATAKEGVLSVRRRAGMVERKRLTALAEVMVVTRNGAGHEIQMILGNVAARYVNQR
jgi:peptide deformylase